MRLRVERYTAMGATLTLLIGGVSAALVVTGGIAGWEYSNSDAFCTNVCHSVHPEESRAHAASYHARVHCVECHMGRMSTLRLIPLKLTHVDELLGMIVGYHRPITTRSLRPAREACETCHWPQARHDDTLRVNYRYDDDPKSTQTRITLVLHTGSGNARAAGLKEIAPQIDPRVEVNKGIHWHIAWDVEYVALDPQKQKIVLVEVHGSDGKLLASYFDPAMGVSRADAERMPRRQMDCIDCHNATGHPFTNPADLVDEALQEGLIDRSLPSIKRRSDDIIEQADGIAVPESERAARFRTIIAATAPRSVEPHVRPPERAFEQEMEDILLVASFRGERDGRPLRWRDFPNNIGHKNSPGCFRCHDGKHASTSGNTIRLQCTLCHSLPAMVKEDGAHTVAPTIAAGLIPPDSHSAANWMRNHGSRIDDTCAACHGKIQYGTQGGSFCANPACHGRVWPGLAVDAASAPSRAQTGEYGGVHIGTRGN